MCLKQICLREHCLHLDGHFFPDFPSVAGQDFTTYKDNNCGSDKSCSAAGIGYKPRIAMTRIQNFSLNMNWDVGNGTLTSVTGWAGYEYNDDVDVDWLPLQFIDRSDIHDFEQFSQEVRWASDIGDRFTYTVGAYYDENELDMEGQVGIDTNFDGLFPSVCASCLSEHPFPIFAPCLQAGPTARTKSARNHNFNQETESWAFFAQGTYELTDSLRLTAGLRYTEEEKDAVSVSVWEIKTARQILTALIQSVGMTGAVLRVTTTSLTLFRRRTFNTYNKEWVGSRKTDDCHHHLTCSGI